MEAVRDGLFRIAHEIKALFIGDMDAQMRRFWMLMTDLARDGLVAQAERLAALGRRPHRPRRRAGRDAGDGRGSGGR